MNREDRFKSVPATKAKSAAPVSSSGKKDLIDVSDLEETPN